MEQNDKNRWMQRIDEPPAADEPQREDSAADAEEDVEYFVPRADRRGDTPLDVEVVRVRRDDDFDAPITEEPADETAEAASPATEGGGDGEEVPMTRRERFRLLRQIVLGTILNSDSVRENYRHAISLAAMLFVSIVMLFSSLRCYLDYRRLEDETGMLRERAIRMSELRYECSSHSAIVRSLVERGIKLGDPQEPHEILK